MQPPNDKLTDALTKRYDVEADAYLAYWAPVLREPSLKLVQQITASSAERVLDIGAGTGTLLSRLATKFPRAQIIGVDRSSGMLGKTRGRAPVAVMDALDLAFRDNVFDVAVMCFVLFHFTDPVAGLTEARRVLRPGGYFCASTWGSDIESRAVDVWNELLDASGADDVDRLANHDLMDSPDKVGGLLASAGFLSVRVVTHDFAFQTQPEDFLNLRTRVGMSSQRLKTLGVDARLALLDRARERLAQLASEDFVLRMQIILAYARAP